MTITLLFACQTPESDVDPTKPAPVADPLTAALGGCTATIDTLDEDGPYSTTHLVQDDHGDLTEAETVYAARGDVYRSIWEWDAPHAVSALTYDAPGTDDDYAETYLRTDGRITTIETDAGGDGTVDARELRAYDTDGLRISNAWDYDADGTVDDTITFVWEALDDGWLAEGDGQDPEGVYVNSLWADEDRRIHRSVYDDDRGHHLEWSDSPEVNVLGLSERSERHETFERFAWHDVTTRTFDDEGRFASAVFTSHTRLENETFDRRTESTWTWHCP